MLMNQRPESRSKRMRGSVVKLLVNPGFSTGWKKISLLASRAPSATPVALLKLRKRPLSAIMNWVGPAAPMVSGGNEDSVSARVAPRKLTEVVCGVCGKPPGLFVGAGQCVTNG